MAVNFSKYQEEITKAWRDVVDSKQEQKWALFGYEGSTNVIKLMATGSQGLEELVEELNCSLIQYAFCRVIEQSIGLNKLVLINWQGDSAPLSRKGLCASHVGDVANYFRGCSHTITIRNDDEATKEHLMEQILKTTASKLGLSRNQASSPSTTNNGTSTSSVRTTNDTNDNTSIDSSVSSSTPSSVYKKVDIDSDIAASRKSFWQRQEEEEKERLAEEKRRAAEKQAQFERERKQREEFEAKKLAETIRERDRLIEATKRADKSTGANQPSSIVSTSSSSSTTTTDAADDDGRVGRRSELIRLERNQETQSLISKGLIKNKRAIFEQQAQQQQQQQNQQPTLSRRASGAMIAKRMNAFKSLDSSTNSITSNINDGSTNISSVNKLSDSFAKQVSIGGDESAKASPMATMTTSTPVSATTVKREIESVKLTREDVEVTPSSEPAVVASTIETKPATLDETPKEIVVESLPRPRSQQSHETNGTEKQIDVGQDVNGNSENSFSKKSPISETIDTTTITEANNITNEELIMNGRNSNIKAIALYDYQAADNTEISFDPDDQIGHIQKVDPGWWHGQVVSGRFKGQIGLFPANYVQEI